LNGDNTNQLKVVLIGFILAQIGVQVITGQMEGFALVHVLHAHLLHPVDQLSTHANADFRLNLIKINQKEGI